uniref:Nucleotid_trans domain-containing protein n=1 Tax=Macrostomum lignano TaxID=282301 RepID=A0A1I8HU28_9PLAT
PYLHAVNNFRMRRLVSNAIMYSAPKHPFWMFYLHHLRQSLIGLKPRESTMQATLVTGPVQLTEAALLFQQAHNKSGCPGLWCPYLAPPVQFLPMYDNSTEEMLLSFRQLCRNPDTLRSVEFADECRRFEPHGFRNYPLAASQSHSFHAFRHLNQRARDSETLANVTHWGINLTIGSQIATDIKLLRAGTD